MVNEKWTEGKTDGCVVSDTPNRHGRDDNVDYYGGYLIAESIPKKEYVNLIATAPDLYAKLDDLRTMLEEVIVYLDLADVDVLIFKQAIKDIESLLAKANGESRPQSDPIGELAQACQRLREIIRNEFSSDGENWQAIKKYQADVDQALVAIRNVRGESEGQDD